MMREVCKQCDRPINVCLCELAWPFDHNIRLHILQHPKEQNHAKGSAKLLSMCAQNSVIYVATFFSEETFSGDLLDVKKTVLLYPDPTEAGGVSEPDTINSDRLRLHIGNSQEVNYQRTKHPLAYSQIEHVVILDSTWRKSRRMLIENAWLTSLPRLSLPKEKSRYAIRKRETDYQLSTFESAIFTLKLLNDIDSVQCEQLMQAFDTFNARFLSFVPNNTVNF